jgi:hypothetical protein
VMDLLNELNTFKRWNQKRKVFIYSERNFYRD